MRNRKRKATRFALTNGDSSESCSSPKGKAYLHESYGLEEDDVVAYLLSVKVAFADEAKFIKFVQLLKDYKAEKIVADDFVQEAKILFEHHPDLLLAFNAFLPEDKAVAVEFFLEPLEEECQDFIIKLKDLSPTIQKRFLSTMKNYVCGRMPCDKIIETVTILLCKYKDLLSEFNKFIPCEIKEEDLASEGPRRKRKMTECNLPELVFNKQISFFEKAKVMLKSKKALKELFTLLEKHLEGRIATCEVVSEVKTLCPTLEDDVVKLFLHEHPSYIMLSKKEKNQQHEESNFNLVPSPTILNTPPCKQFKPQVLNDYCHLIAYDLSEGSLQAKQESTQEHSKDQEKEQKSFSEKELDIDSLQDGYVVEKHRNKRTLKAINSLLSSKIKEKSDVDFNKLLTGFNFTSIRKCCDDEEIRLLKTKNAEVLPKIKKAIKKRQRKLKKRLKEIKLEKAQRLIMDSMKASEVAQGKGKRVKKQH